MIEDLLVERGEAIAFSETDLMSVEPITIVYRRQVGYELQKGMTLIQQQLILSLVILCLLQ